MLELQHDLRLKKTRDEKGRMNFVGGLRSFVLNDMAKGMRAVYEAQVRPEFERRRGRAPRDGAEVLGAMRPNETFRFYSALRVTAQDMVYQAVRTPLERQRDEVNARARSLRRRKAHGSLTLDPALEVPRSVSAIDVHLMPGSYAAEYDSDDATAGAIYDNRLAVSSIGLMGRNLDDIGQSISRFVRARYPQFQPKRILDLGCTIGHNTCAWAETYREAEVVGIDVAAPCLRYAHARAEAQGRAVHFRQMNAEALDFPDASFDVVFSSMFLHEVLRKGIVRIFAEAHRVLKPGGLMLHMELPPNSQMSPYEGFYLDWDSFYNNEPFYKPFRDMKPEALCTAAGFAPRNYVQFVVPSIGGYGRQAWADALREQPEVDSDKTGRLAAGVRWFCFGAWK